MDQSFLRNIGYFAVPNNQTLNPVDQSGDVLSPDLSLWEEPALTSTGYGQTQSASPGTPGLPLDPLATSAAAAASLNPYGSLMSSPSVFGQSPRPILAPRLQRAKDGHERKRSRLNTEATPFDSVDYWMQFDQDQQLQQQQRQQQQELLEQQQLQIKQLQMQQQQQLLQAQRQRQQMQQQRQKQKSQSKSSDRKDSVQSPGLSFEADTPGTTSSSQLKAPTPAQRQPSVAASQTLSTAPQKSEELGPDDTALENALSEEGEEGFSYSSLNLADQLSGIDVLPPAEIPQREGLYSTPLSWERPQMGMRLDSMPMLGLQSSALSEAEQRRLIAIAMNGGTTASTLGTNMNNLGGFPMFGGGLGTASLSQISNNSLMGSMTGSPDSAMPPPSSSKQDSKQSKDKGKEKPKSADRTAHNDIERKYRTNLKDRIAELRDAVPALSTIHENGGDEGEGEGSNQGGRGPKISKGTVLTKATDYIHQLEKKQKAIIQQHQELSRRLQAFEQLLNAAARPTFQMPNYSRALFDPRAFC